MNNNESSLKKISVLVTNNLMKVKTYACMEGTY